FAFLLLLCAPTARPSPAPLFPYTTLFRSVPWRANYDRWDCGALRSARRPAAAGPERKARSRQLRHRAAEGPHQRRLRLPADPARSEEHTSELQSRVDLVCRLLLEQKNLNS